MTRTPTRLVVEQARIADVDRVALLFDSYRQFYGAAPDLEAARSFIAERLTLRESIVLMAVPERREGGDALAAGFAQLYPSFSSVALAPIVVLNDLFVAPLWRRLGVARCLVEEAVAYARKSGAVRIELATQLTNRHALRLYESQGFVRDEQFIHLDLAL
jgi:ribosomal protein S18 acetylase RimI-like enzyme